MKSESLSPMNNIKKTAIPPPRLGGRFSGPAPRLHHSGFRTFNDPVMTAADMQAELERLHQINLTVKDGDFDHSAYPISVGVDPRNGKMLMEKLIFWYACPDVGMVFLLYGDVETEQACVDALVGSPLISPEPIPGEYSECRPVVDWVNLPERTLG